HRNAHGPQGAHPSTPRCRATLRTNGWLREAMTRAHEDDLLSHVSHQASGVRGPAVSRHPSLITHHSPRVTSHQSRVTSHESPVTSHQSRVTSHQSPITGSEFQ